jgi:glycosyltransferase involved in cell wall biosynthesis
LNILILNYRDLAHPKAGGAEVHLHEIFGRIAAIGHKVFLLTTGFDGAEKEDLRDGIHIHRMGRDWNFNILCTLRLHYFIKKWKIDIIVEDLNKLPFYTPLLSRTPSVIQFHHLWGKSIYHETNFITASYVWLQENIIPYFYKQKLLISVSPSTSEELIKLGMHPARISLIYNGYNSKLYHPGSSKRSPPYALWLGRLRRYKGPDIAIEAFKRFCLIHKDFELKIAGSGPMLTELEEMVNRYDLGHKVSFLGYVSEVEKVELMQGAAWILQTSYKEGWGLTIIEANATGTPAIASDALGLKDSVQNKKTGLLFERGNSEDLYFKMCELANNLELLNNLSLNAKEWANQFSWDESATQTLQVLQRALKQNAGKTR